MPRTTFEKGERFAQLHAAGIFVVPNPWSTGTARVLRQLGFQALATTSAGLAFSQGLRDGDAAVDLETTMDHARQIVEATDLPVTADLEDGFGATPEAVAKAVRSAGEVGLVGGSIEDATYDEAEPLHGFGLAVERIHAAVEAAEALPFPFTLTARTEGFIRGRPDFDETVRRLVAFQEAGADVLYAPGLPDLDSLRALCVGLERPVNHVVGVGPFQASLSTLREAGVRRVSTGSSLARAAFGGLFAAAQEIFDEGTFHYTESSMSVRELNAYFD